MRASSSVRRFLIATAAVACAAGPMVASASEAPDEANRLQATRGARPLDVSTIVVPVGSSASTEILQWQVAAVDASLLATPAASLTSTLAARPASLDAASIRRDGVNLSPRSMADAGFMPGRLPEPGTWSAALATSALAIFFFLRRMS